MTKEGLYAGFEGHEFAARINIVSGSRQFLLALNSQPAMLELFDAAKDERVAIETMARVLRLARQSIDLRYENPFDVAMSAYLLVLQQTQPELARIAAEVVLASPNCWWARKTAQMIWVCLLCDDGPSAGRMEPFLVSLNVERPVLVEIPAQVGGSELDDSLGHGFGPAHA